jgi:hypothetical protein
MPDAELKRLMKNLEEAINESLSGSAKINEAVQNIHAAGYEAFMIIDATLGFHHKGKGENEKVSDLPKIEDPVRLRITSEDAKFLKSLKIAIETED